MARRRRRGRFNRINPDMGWWVDQGKMSFQWDEPEGVALVNGTAESIIQFSDITDDDSLILRDNSDWFIKRVMIEAFPMLEPAGNSGDNVSDTRRLWTLSVGTIDNDKLAEWVVNQPHTLFEPGGYEMWARMLRTYNRPVYHDWKPLIITGAAPSGALLSLEPGSGNPRFRDATADWGTSSVIDDFSVSNAGLKPEQSLSIAIGGLNPGDTGDDWKDNEFLTVRWALRVLLQKRRAA